MKNLPKGWKMHELGDFIQSLESGVSVNSTDEERHAGTKRVLKISAVANGVFLPHQNKVVTKQDEHRTKLNPKAGSIIISRANTAELVGQCGYVDKDYPELFLPDKLWQTVFYEDAEISTRWLTYFLSSDLVKPLLLGAATGTSGSMKNISKYAFLEIPVPTPPLVEQQRIAAILDACDRAIDGTVKLLEKQEKRKKALTNELLHLNSLAIPNGWAMHEVGDFVSALESGVSVNSTEDEKQGSGKRILKTSAVFNGEFYPAKNKIITRADEQRAKLNPKANTIIISRMNTVELVGQSGYVAESHADIFLPDRLWQTVFRDEHAQSVKWLSYYLSSDRVRASIRNAASGTSGSMKNIAQEAFLKIPVLTPPLEKQHNIARVLETADKEIKLLRQQLTLLQQQKKGLMQRLLTGQAFTH